MKVKKYEELLALKGKLTEEKCSYRSICEKISMSVDAFNNKINGYSVFTTDEVDKIVEEANISHNDIVKYFFPSMLRNATKSA